MRVLVTGAAGFIGSHLTEALVREGHEVRALVRYTSRGTAGWLDTVDADVAAHIEIVKGDVRDAHAVKRAAAGATHIYHLAALIGIPYSYESPDAYIATNVLGTANVLDAARDLGDRLERLVHTSTSECYGTALSVPIDENHRLQAQSPYSATKIAADKLAESYQRSFGLRVVTIRPFNTYGPRQSTRAVIPTIITQVLAGGVVRLGNMTTTRDLCYVADTVRGFVLAGSTAAADGRVVNLGTGREVSVAQLVTLVGRVLGREPVVETEEGRVRPAASEVERLVADATVARDLLGWTPQISLEQGLERTVSWIREHRDQFRVAGYHV
jgi:NAD dependent epimerase/dehydratase